jgi:anti-anti-sigma regulatory factor
MVTAAAPTPAILNLTAATPDDGLMLVDVVGELDGDAVGRWSRLVNSAITDGATGFVVDLRGCPAIDLGCLSVLVAGSGRLKALGGRDIHLVNAPGSPVERKVRATAARRLPAYSSAAAALVSIRAAPSTLKRRPSP